MVAEKAAEVISAEIKETPPVSAKSTTPDPTKYVPVTILKDVTKRCEVLEAAALSRDCNDFIAGGMEGGQIVASNRDMWERHYKVGPAQAAKDLKTAPVIVATGKVDVDAGGAPTDSRQLVIASAVKAFKTDPELSKPTTPEWLVKGELRQKLPPGSDGQVDTKLTDDEKKLIGA